MIKVHDNLGKPLNPLVLWPQAIVDAIAGLRLIGQIRSLSSRVETPVRVNDHFFGINIATSSDERCDEFVLESVRKLGIQHVRIDFSYESIGGDAERLLDKALAENLEVMLDIFPSIADAQKIGKNREVDQRWYDFVETVFRRYQHENILFEIGNTPNRRSWSGFNPIGFLNAWHLVVPLIESYGVKVAGPNISDFEPIGNLCLLAAIKRLSSVPSIHTTNLFVERVVEPEANDHHVLGALARDWLRLNLVKKARLLEDLGQAAGCEESYCAYTCWTLPRLRRWSVHPEQKQADYLMRYMILAAASGAMSRAYWGALICNRDGLIDCGDENYPAIDHASHYHQVRGNFEDLRIRPAFHAFTQTISILSGSTCHQAVHSQDGLHHFVFVSEDRREFHVAWCRDGFEVPLRLVYPQELWEVPGLEVENVTGDRRLEKPTMIGEQPLVLRFPSIQLQLRPDADRLSELELVVTGGDSESDVEYLSVANGEWRGGIVLYSGQRFSEQQDKLLPEKLELAKVEKLIRDKRNKVWNVAADDRTLTVKLNRAVGGKKLSYRFFDSKAKRHWDNARDMLRLGIATPQPIAYFERPKRSGIEPNYYVSEFLEDAFTARDVFTSINNNEPDYRDMSHEYLLELIGRFVCRMHARGILHRDLSSGNILLTCHTDRASSAIHATPYLTDIGRAKVKAQLSTRERLIDIMRILYKLKWPQRERFMIYYLGQHRSVFRGWRTAVKYYVFKQQAKRRIKTWIGKV
jgi:tRNA A-37 threonylcarbamoyl transferase component Bud32